MDLNPTSTGIGSAGTFTNGSRRATGLGLVIGIHVLAVIGISAAYIRPTPTERHTTQLQPNVPIERPQEPPPTIRLDKPNLPDIRMQPIDPPPVPDPSSTNHRLTPNTNTDVPDTVGREPQDFGGGSTTLTPSKPEVPPALRNPGAICVTMPKPEVPALNWAGDAMVHALATVRGGRVVSTELSIAGAALDPRSKRALKQAVEGALAGYHCPGDHQFQQDFAFQLD